MTFDIPPRLAARYPWAVWVAGTGWTGHTHADTAHRAARRRARAQQRRFGGGLPGYYIVEVKK